MFIIIFSIPHIKEHIYNCIFLCPQLKGTQKEQERLKKDLKRCEVYYTAKKEQIHQLEKELDHQREKTDEERNRAEKLKVKVKSLEAEIAPIKAEVVEERNTNKRVGRCFLYTIHALSSSLQQVSVSMI